MSVVPETLECLHCGVVGDATLTTAFQWRVINDNDVLCKHCWFLNWHPESIGLLTLPETDRPVCSRCGVVADTGAPQYWMQWYTIDNKDVCKRCWADHRSRAYLGGPVP